MNTLRKRLTALYTITTGTILLGIITAIFIASVHNTQNAQRTQFELIWNTLSSRFLSSNAFSHGFLAKTEADYRILIHIRENGIPFLYSGSWTPSTSRDLLIQTAVEQAKQEGVSINQAPVSSSLSTTSLMTIQGEHNDHYYAMVLSAPTKSGSKSLCVISLIQPVQKTLTGHLLYLCLLSVLGLGFLWLFSWKFVGWSLAPIEENRKKQAQFIAAASHELRSPLAVIRSGLSALALEQQNLSSQNPQKKDTLLPLIDSECVRMSRLIDDMLLLASADAKTWSIRPETMDMDTFLIDLYESFQPACREKEIALRLDLPDHTLFPVHGDPQRLRQLFLILLDNAKAFTPPKRSIIIRARTNPKKHTLILQVINEGCKIAPKDLPYIFDRFYQADSSRSDKQHFGLGLSIAKELTKLHRGSITAASDPDGRTCFTVTLPAAPTCAE